MIRHIAQSLLLIFLAGNGLTSTAEEQRPNATAGHAPPQHKRGVRGARPKQPRPRRREHDDDERRRNRGPGDEPHEEELAVAAPREPSQPALRQAQAAAHTRGVKM